MGIAQKYGLGTGELDRKFEDMTEQEFITSLRLIIKEVVGPNVEQQIKDEVNRQMKELTAVLVSGLIRK